MCQEALSQIHYSNLLAALCDFWQHHDRKRVVMELTGLPSTKRTPPSPARAQQHVAGDGLRSFDGIILGDRLFDEAQGLTGFALAIEASLASRLNQLSSKKPTTS